MSTSSLPEKSFLAALQTHLPVALPQFLLQQRWFGGKARPIQSVEIPDIVPLNLVSSYLVLARVNYASGPVETYALPLVRYLGRSRCFISENPARQLLRRNFSQGCSHRPAISHSTARSHRQEHELTRHQGSDSCPVHLSAAIPLAACPGIAHSVTHECGTKQQLGGLWQTTGAENISPGRTWAEP